MFQSSKDHFHSACIMATNSIAFYNTTYQMQLAAELECKKLAHDLFDHLLCSQKLLPARSIFLMDTDHMNTCDPRQYFTRRLMSFVEDDDDSEVFLTAHATFSSQTFATFRGIVVDFVIEASNEFSWDRKAFEDEYGYPMLNSSWTAYSVSSCPLRGKFTLKGLAKGMGLQEYRI